MSYPQAQSMVADAERVDDMLDVMYHGWSVWPIVRPVAITKLTGATFAVDRADARSLTSVAHRFRDAAADGISYAGLRYVDRVFGTHATSLTHEVGAGQFGDTFVQEVVDSLPGSMILETPNDRRFSVRRPKRSSRYVTSGGIQIAGAIGRRLAPPRDLAAIADELSERIHRAFGRRLVERGDLLSMLAHFAWSKRLHDVFFRRVRPRQVIVIDWSEHGMIAAAKACGAEVVDMQHGILNEGAYLWPDSAVGHRQGMPVADRLLMFGPYWAEQLESTSFWQGRVAAVGSIPLDRVRARSTVPLQDRRTVLFTAQGIQPEATAAFFKDFLDIAPGDLQLIIKIHPVYSGDRQIFRRVLGHDSRVSIVSHDADISSLDLIARARVHVSISSTSHFEAVGLGTPTVFLPLQTWENIGDLEVRGHALRADSPQDLLRVFRDPAGFQYPSSVVERYYTQGAVGNIVRALSWSE